MGVSYDRVHSACLTGAYVKQFHNFQDKHESDMHIEFRHLRTVKAIHDCGGLARAADQLNITQSALSHQIKGLEDQAGVELFIRRSKPMKLSPAGMKLLRAAERILPEVAALQEEFLSLKMGKTGRLHIAIECHACFEWLFPVLEGFRQSWPEIDVDIRPGLSFDGLPALLRDQMLITYPVDRTRLDVFTELLLPAGVEPRATRQVELTAVILLLVASNRGVAVLPDWVVREVRYNSDYVTRPLTKGGKTKRLYAATRSEDTQKPFMSNVIRLARTEPVKLQRAGEDA
jgi:LysR family transcriptional regulator for metE and metH